MALVPPEEAEKKENPLLSRKGEILASRKDFRMNTCTPHANGAFMLELAGLSPIQYLFARQQEGGLGNAAGAQSTAQGAASTPMEVSTCHTPVPVLDFSADGGAVGPDCDDDDDGGGGGGDAMLPDVPQGGTETAPGGTERIEQQASAPQRKGYLLRERLPAVEASIHIKEMLDPWRSIDPFSSSEEKPLKKGRPFMVPRGLDDVPGTKRKRRASGKLQEFMKWFSATQHDGADGRKSRRKGPTFADLEVLYWKHMKERVVAQRRLHRRTQGTLLARPLEQLLEPPQAEEELNPVEENREDSDLDNGEPDDFLEHMEHPAEIPEELAEGVMGPGEIPDLLSYEELVRRNVELFIANSQKYARETVLSRRVRDWEEMMGPQLQEQEERAAFDIHSYGDRLASNLGHVGEWRSFASLVAGEPAFEVCRYMLASLQLANDYTVEVSQGPGLEEALDTMALRLLTQERAHERFRTYAAPSLAQE